MIVATVVVVYLLIGGLICGALWETKQIKENRAYMAEHLGTGAVYVEVVAGVLGVVLWPLVIAMRIHARINPKDPKA